VQCRHFVDKGEEGSSDADVRAFLRKNTEFFENLWCVHTDKDGEGVEPLWTRGRDQFFVILCGRLLWPPLIANILFCFFRAYFSLQILQFLLVGAQKYFCLRPQVPSSYASGVASGGTSPGAQVLGAHQHTFCSHSKTRFKEKFRPKYV